MPILVRVSGTDWHEGGNTIDDMAIAARLLGDAGADAIHVSAGGNTPHSPATYPGYMVQMAETIRQKAGVPTVAVGLIRTPEMAESIIRNERADLVALGRELLRSPQWPLEAARELGVDLLWPEQYEQAKL
jgi:NADPH2 dehydrogenase